MISNSIKVNKIYKILINNNVKMIKKNTKHLKIFKIFNNKTLKFIKIIINNKNYQMKSYKIMSKQIFNNKMVFKLFII